MQSVAERFTADMISNNIVNIMDFDDNMLPPKYRIPWILFVIEDKT